MKENQENLQTTPPTTRTSRTSSDQDSTPCKTINNSTHIMDDIGDKEDDNESGEHFLYFKRQCQWPGCGRDCGSPNSWRHHMEAEHGLSERSTAQARIQMQLISQLEVQLNKEKSVLSAMMKHLHPDTEMDTGRDSPAKRRRIDSPPPSLPASLKMSSESSLPPSHRSSLPDIMKLSQRMQQDFVSQGQSFPPVSLPQYANPLTHLMNLTPSSPALAPLAALSTPPSMPPSHLSHHNSLRSSLGSEKSPFSPHSLSASGGGGGDSHRRRMTHHDRGNPNLDPEEDLAKNREFYRTQDVRPPYTYAALIRAAILEAPYQQLTLHDIYNWFTTTFCYFRRNAASWKVKTYSQFTLLM